MLYPAELPGETPRANRPVVSRPRPGRRHDAIAEAKHPDSTAIRDSMIFADVQPPAGPADVGSAEAKAADLATRSRTCTPERIRRGVTIRSASHLPNGGGPSQSFVV